MSLEVRTSERRTFKRCQYKWLWRYKEELVPLTESAPLWFGTAVHLALAEWYKPGSERGEHPAVTFAKALDNGEVKHGDLTDPEKLAEFTEHHEMGVDMMKRYVDTYGTDEQWEVIQPELPFRVWFPSPFETHWLRYLGTIDAVVRNKETGEIWLVEHKTAASININHLPLDDQAGSYWALAQVILRKMGLLGADEVIAGIMYNFLRKAKDDPRPKNADGLYTNKPVKQDYLDQLTAADVQCSATMKVDELAALAKQHGVQVLGEASKTQPPAYFERVPVYRSQGARKTMLKRIVDEGRQIEAARQERPLLPLVKNPTKDCSWDCEFFKMCQLHEDGQDWQYYKDTMFKNQSPYDEHERKSA